MPFLLEATFVPAFTISIPGSPLSLGRLCLVALGFIGFSLKIKNIPSSPFRVVIFLLVFGSFVGTMFSKRIGMDLVSYIGFSVLLFSSLGASSLIRFPETKSILKYFFYLAYAYWVYYVYNITLSGGKLVTYGEIYRLNRMTDSSLVNYHAFGLVISAAMVYIAQLKGWLKKLNLIGVIFVLIGISALFVTESRANLIITLIVFLSFYLVNNSLRTGTAIRLGILVVLVGILASEIMSMNSRLDRRYDIEDTEYIQQTTQSRFIFIALTFKELMELPFGGGVKNNRVDFFGTDYQPHNQYLTYILFAGVFGLIANIIWFFTFSKSWLGIVRRRMELHMPYLASLTVTMLALFTNDLGGAFFLLMLIFQSWLAQEALINNKRIAS